MRTAEKLIRRLPQRTRAATVALVGVVAGATGVAGIAAQAFEGEPIAPPDAEARATSDPGDLVDPVVDGAADPVINVRRAPVGEPVEYPGSITKAPQAAIAAYQRAEAVINTAADCDLDWVVLAAIGRVESDHGRGLDAGRPHRIGAKGRVSPALVGDPLDGTGGNGQLVDTDLGRFDGSVRWDAPVGPLGLLPSTWSAVAVDSDADGKRDEQDLDDAALGAAVVLCASSADGATRTSTGAAEGARAGAGRSRSKPARTARGGDEDPSAGRAKAAKAGDHGRRGGDDRDGHRDRPQQLRLGAGIRSALRDYHRAPDYVATIAEIAQRYQRQSVGTIPDYDPPGGVRIPDEMPDLCACADVAETSPSDEASPSGTPRDPKGSLPHPATPSSPTGPGSGGPTDPDPTGPVDPPDTTGPPDPPKTTETPTYPPTDPTDPSDPSESASASADTATP